MLIEDFKSRDISLASRLPLERTKNNPLMEGTSADQSPPLKKIKLEQDLPDPLSVQESVCAYNAIRGVLEGKSPQAKFWLLVERKSNFLDFVLHVSMTSKLLCCFHLIGGLGVWLRLPKSLIESFSPKKVFT